LIGDVTGSVVGDITGSVFADDSSMLVDAVAGKVIINNNTTAELPEQGNLYFTDARADARVNSIVSQTYVNALNITATSTVGTVVGTVDGDVTGSVFGDDSTLLVDGVNNKVTLTNNTTTELTEGTRLYYTDVRADARITNAGSANWNAAFAWGNHASVGYQVAGTPHDGDITGSVFGDDSTLLVDGNNNKIVGVVDTTSIRTSEDKIALGENTGVTNQAYGAIAIGPYAGTTDQGSQAVAVGTSAGRERQGSQATALGRYAGQNDQGVSAVAIGHSAGRETQGTVAIAIGKLAGETNQAANSIVINATGSAVENTTASSLRIKPIRNVAMTTILGYNATSGEVTHNAVIPGYINLADLKTEVAASADFAAFKTRIAAL
jgi:hypothetical protein